MVMDIHIYSEDGGQYADQIIKNVVNKTVLSGFPEVAYKLVGKINYYPTNRDLRSIVVANKWTSKKEREQRDIITLKKTIAEKLIDDNAFVIFHFDGDAKWADRSPAKERLFEERIRNGVEEILNKIGRKDKINNLLPRQQHRIHFSLEKMISAISCFSSMPLSRI